MRRPAKATTSARRSAGRSGRSWATSWSQNSAISVVGGNVGIGTGRVAVAHRPSTCCGRVRDAGQPSTHVLGCAALDDSTVGCRADAWRRFDRRAGRRRHRPGGAPGARARLARPRRPRRRRLRAARRRVHAPLGGGRAGDRPPHVGRGRACRPTARRHGYDVVRRGSRYTVFPRTAVAELAGRMGRSDALVEVWNGVPWFSPVWYRRPHMTILHHVHGPMWDQIMPPPLAGAGRLLEARLAPPFYRRTLTVTPSEATREELHRARVPARAGHGRRQRRRPVLLARRRSLAAPDGRRRRPPGAGEALRAAARGRRAGPASTCPTCSVRIVGEGPLRADLERWIAEHDAAGWVDLLGHLSRGQLRDEYRRAWLVGSASLAEGWGLSLTEGRRAARRPWRPTSAATAARSSTGAPGVLVAPDDARPGDRRR